MYLKFYQLNQKPFQITTDPDFLWLGEKHAEALATLKYGILEDKGFLLLTGDVGTGKTALIKLLLRTIDVAAIVAAVPDPGLEPIDFFNFLAEEFRMDRHFASKGEFLIEFKQFLLNAYSTEQKVLLIIDEAQRLTIDMLEQVRLLSNIELDNRKLINIFFVGQQEFNQMLMDERSKALRQRITANYHIEPLEESETLQYIQHRLKVAGARTEIFTSDAMRRVHVFSRGYPRLINIICDHALLTGYAKEAKQIDVQLIRECEKELRMPEMRSAQSGARAEPAPATAAQPHEAEPLDRPFNWRLPAALIFLLLLVFTGAMFYQYRDDNPQRWSAEDLAPQSYKGLSGKPLSVEPTPAREPEPGPAPQPTVVPQPPPTVAVAESGGAPAAIQAKRLAANPFAQGRVIIFFPYNSNELTEEALEALDKIAAFLKTDPRMKVSIMGYTDAVGTITYNLSVSQFRANSIKSYLAGKGVDPENLIAVGLGPKNPIASNDTLEGRQQNRRVEIELVKP
jgi:general secretion pathway protein A